MNAPSSGDPAPSAPFEVERVEWIPSSAEVLEVRVTGRWRAGTPDGAVALVVDDAGAPRPFAAAAAAAAEDGAWTARFAVPVELRPALTSHLALRADDREVALPAASPGPTDEATAPPAATVVDPGVLEELRARREGQADEGALRRAAAAEATVTTLETQLGYLEARLRDTLGERDELTARLRAAEQSEEAERRVRGEAEDERTEALAQADSEIALLRGRVGAAEEHAAALSAQLDAVRREAAEAQHAAGSARLVAERALADGVGAQVELDRLQREATELSEALETQRAGRVAAEQAVTRQADRVSEVEATITLLEHELERRASIQTAVQGELEQLRGALTEIRGRTEEQAVRETAALATLQELQATAGGLRDRLAAVEEAERVARAQVRETQGELAARDGDLGRLRVELERGKAELAAAHARQDGATAALREAERTVVAVRQEAAELQSRLEDERRRRFEAEASLKVELARERERFGEHVADVEADLRARIAAERTAFEGQAASIEELVGALRTRLASAGAELEARLGEHERARDEAFAARDAARAEVDAVKLAVAADLEQAAAGREQLLARVAALDAELVLARPAVEAAERALAEAEAAGREAVIAALTDGAAELAAARSAADGELSAARAAAEREQAALRTEHEAALAAARAETERRVLEIGAELASRLVEVEAERDGLLLELEARDAELVALRAAAADGEARQVAVEALVAEVVATAGELRQGFDAQLAALTDRVEAEVSTLRSQLSGERTARLVAEQELAVERERGTAVDASAAAPQVDASVAALDGPGGSLDASGASPGGALHAPGSFAAASLHRTELEATRRELAAAQEALAAERLRTTPPAGPTAQLVRDLDAAESRLKDAIPPAAAVASTEAEIDPGTAPSNDVIAAAETDAEADPAAAAASTEADSSASADPSGPAPSAAPEADPSAAAVAATSADAEPAAADPHADAEDLHAATADPSFDPAEPGALVDADQPPADGLAPGAGEVPHGSRDAVSAALAALTASRPPGPPPGGVGIVRPAEAVAAAFAAAQPETKADAVPDDAPPELPTPPPAATPLNPRIVRASERPAVGWLAPAIAKLAKEDDALAAELVLELLPAQAGTVKDPVAYGITIDGHGSYRVVVNGDRALVESREGEFWPADIDVSVGGAPAALAPLVAGTARRRLPGTRIAGRKRRLRKLLKARRAPLDLGDLAERGIRPAPEPLLAVLAAAIDPTWTAGHAFGVVYALAGGETVEVEIRDGEAPRVQTGMRARTEAPAATVALRDIALLPLLSHTHLPPGERVLVAGDRHAVALLHSWFDRAQGLPAA